MRFQGHAAVLVGWVTVGACYVDRAPNDQLDASSPKPDSGVLPFQADTPFTYVAKVKNLLVGLPPTDAELQAVASEPTQLRTLIGNWMSLPEYDVKMRRFFDLAFQQAQIADADFAMQTGGHTLVTGNQNVQALYVQNAQESMARTMLLHGAQGAGITDAFTTTEFAMTTALMELYAHLDTRQIGDSDSTGQGPTVDGFKQTYNKQQIYVSASMPVSETETENPSSPNFMHFYVPSLANQSLACNTYSQTANADIVFDILAGSTSAPGSLNSPCNPVQDDHLTTSLLTQNDFQDWRLVKIRQPQSGEQPTQFFQLANLRTSNELVLDIPRVGFFSTPAFFANWDTNDSNTMRVTMNQAFIVALGAQVDGTDTTIPQQTPGLNADHASQPACSSCHQLLDPSRAILSATYSWSYHTQDLSPAALVQAGAGAQPGFFAFQGVQKPVNNVAELAAALASHPLVAPAWVQKLCVYANSSPCDTTDPEFQRVVSVFQNSGLSWSALVTELMSSPLVTNAMATQTTTTHGETVAVSRLDHFCAALDARLGLTDICGLNATIPGGPFNGLQTIAGGLPANTYGRGQVIPNLATDPTLFYRGMVEAVCASIATVVVDGHSLSPPIVSDAGAVQWSSTNVDANGLPTALPDFVTVIMGIEPSDPRYAPALAILTSTYQQSVAQLEASGDGGAGLAAKPAASNALQSVFAMACTAPSSVSIGM